MKTLFTVGFTQKNAEKFFTLLQDAGVRRVVDVRLNNTGQLAGFSKRDDLSFFLQRINGAAYIHIPELAPTADMLSAYRDGKDSWDAYARAFGGLIRKRQIEETLRKEIRDGDCLLCSEATPEQCHRRIVAEYLQHHWKGWEVRHL